MRRVGRPKRVGRFTGACTKLAPIAGLHHALPDPSR